jgi:fucose 4-O-acetylase-like acetyltransferase
VFVRVRGRFIPTAGTVRTGRLPRRPRRRGSDDRVRVRAAVFQADPASPPAGRDHRLDNAKFLLLALVVIGHSSQPYVYTSGVVDAFSYWIYLFHMPAFVFISGYFTRYSAWDGKWIGSVARLVLTYLFLMVFYEQFEGLVTTGRLRLPELLAPDEAGKPAEIMWFLVALVTWRSLAPLLMRIRYPLTFSVAVSLAAGMLPAVTLLALDRTMAMLPFFVLGMSMRGVDPADLCRSLPRPLAAGVLGAALLAAPLLVRVADRGWFHWTRSYHSMGVPALGGMALRIVWMLLAVLLTAAFLALVPRARTWMSGLGAASLYGYAWHACLTWPFVESGGLSGAYTGPGHILALFAGCLGITVVLCSPPVRWLTRPVVEPPVDRLLRRAGASRQAGATDRLAA